MWPLTEEKEGKYLNEYNRPNSRYANKNKKRK